MKGLRSPHCLIWGRTAPVPRPPHGPQDAGFEGLPVLVVLDPLLDVQPVAVLAQDGLVHLVGELHAHMVFPEVGDLGRGGDPEIVLQRQVHRGFLAHMEDLVDPLGGVLEEYFEAVPAHALDLAIQQVVPAVGEDHLGRVFRNEEGQPPVIGPAQDPRGGELGAEDALFFGLLEELDHGLVAEAPVLEDQGDVLVLGQVPGLQFGLRHPERDPVRLLEQDLELGAVVPAGQRELEPSQAEPLDDHLDAQAVFDGARVGGHGEVARVAFR